MPQPPRAKGESERCQAEDFEKRLGPPPLDLAEHPSRTERLHQPWSVPTKIFSPFLVHPPRATALQTTARPQAYAARKPLPHNRKRHWRAPSYTRARRTFNPRVRGSSPRRPTNNRGAGMLVVSASGRWPHKIIPPPVANAPVLWLWSARRVCVWVGHSKSIVDRAF